VPLGSREVRGPAGHRELSVLDALDGEGQLLQTFVSTRRSGEEDGRPREAEGAAGLFTVDPGRIEEVGVDAVRDQYSAEAAGERGGRCGDCRSGARGARQ